MATQRSYYDLDMAGNRLLNVPGLTDALGNPLQGTYVAEKTRLGIQRAIDAATAGDTLILDKEYTNGGMTDPIIVNKALKFIAPRGATINGGTDVGFLMKVYGCDRFSMEDVVFKSQYTGGGNPLLFINQSGNLTNGTFRRCGFTCPSGTTNAINVVAFADNDNVNTVNIYHDTILFEDCWGDGIGRMWLEVLNHLWNGSIRIKNVTVRNCIVKNTGLGEAQNGMVVSYSGDCDSMVIEGLQGYNFSGTGVEFIGTSRGRISDITLLTERNWAGGQTCGISFTDGGNTEGDSAKNKPANPGHNARKNSLGGAIIIDVPGVPLKFYYAKDCVVNGGYYKGQNISLQKSTGITFSAITLESTANSVIEFDNSSNNKVLGGRLISIAPGTTYQKVLFSNGATNNNLDSVFLEGPNSGNGSQIYQNNTTDNKWVDCWLNNVKIPDKTSGSGNVNNSAQLA